jgi:TatD DNase family protein
MPAPRVEFGFASRGAPVIDSHCHLAGEEFADDLPAVVERARAAGLAGALVVLSLGDDGEEARAAMVSGLWSEVRFAAGVHPHEARRFAAASGSIGEDLAAARTRLPLIRAVGEIGLDYHYNLSPPEVQRKVFRSQTRAAREAGLPIVVHTREAEDDTIAILESEAPGGMAGVLHCFTGSERLARWGLSFGLHISFAGIVTFPKAGALRAVSKMVPADRLLVETDSPFLAPVPRRGKRNEPAWVVDVAGALAATRGLATTELARQVTSNYDALFHP